MKTKNVLISIYCIFPALFCLCYINELTLTTRIQQVFVFVYLEIFFTIITWFLQMKFKSVQQKKGKWMNWAVIGGAFFATVIFSDSIMPQYYEDGIITISVSDDKNINSNGREIWLSQINVNKKDIDLMELADQNEGWIYSEGTLYANKDNDPQPLQLSLRKNSPVELFFLKHEWSGMADIQFGNELQTHDLYERERGGLELHVQPQGEQYTGVMRMVLISGFFIICLILEIGGGCLLVKVKPEFSAKYFVVISLVIVGLLLPMRKTVIVVEPLNICNLDSQGTEIWIRSIDGASPAFVENIHMPKGWQSIDDSLVYTGTGEAEPLYVTLNDKKPEIVFGRHSWSGKVKICYGLSSETVDLYSNNGGTYTYSPRMPIPLYGVLVFGIFIVVLLLIERFCHSKQNVLKKISVILKYILCFILCYLLSAYISYISLPAYWMAFLSVIFFTYSLLCRDNEKENPFWVWVIPVVLFLIIEAISNSDGTLLTITAVTVNIFLLALITWAIINIFSYKNTGMYIALIIGFIMSTANHFVIQFKKYAMTPADVLQVKTAVDVAGEYQYKIDNGILMGLLLMLLVVYIAPHKQGADNAVNKVYIKKKILGVVMIATLLSIVNYIDFNSINKTSEKWDNNWDNTSYYSENGFVASFIKYWQDMKMEKPEGYSKEYAENLLLQYDLLNQVDTENDKPIIIAIMNESFSDVSEWIEMGESEEILKFYNSTKDFLEKGNTYVSVLGGGTCNSEFEFLTGNSMEMFEAVYPYTMYNFENVDSLVTSLNRQGYHTVAMHPASPKNYKRDSVYNSLGFDDFYSYQDFDGYEKLCHDHVSDYANYDKILTTIDESKQPLFLFNVTMQNHGPYMLKDLNVNIPIATTDSTLNQYEDLKMFMTLMRESDNALKYLLEELKKREGKIILCIFGDHQPGSLDGSLQTFYKKDEKDSKIERAQLRYKTPYLIWSNFDTNKFENDKEDVISPNFLASTILTYAGVQKTAYQSFMAEMHKDIVASNIFGYLGADGIWYSYDDESPYMQWIKDYRILQYYNIFEQS